jgi:CBS-domain-containing membrane protein
MGVRSAQTLASGPQSVTGGASTTFGDVRVPVPMTVVLAQPDWNFLFLPTLVGAILVVAVAVVYNNATRDARYPKYL